MCALHVVRLSVRKILFRFIWLNTLVSVLSSALTVIRSLLRRVSFYTLYWPIKLYVVQSNSILANQTLDPSQSNFAGQLKSFRFFIDQHRLFSAHNKYLMTYYTTIWHCVRISNPCVA